MRLPHRSATKPIRLRREFRHHACWPPPVERRIGAGGCYPADNLSKRSNLILSGSDIRRGRERRGEPCTRGFDQHRSILPLVDLVAVVVEQQLFDGAAQVLQSIE